MIDQEVLRQLLASAAPDTAERLNTYVSEAIFFETMLLNDVSSLPQQSRILEAGCGVGILSALLAGRGMSVTAVDPQSAGFSKMYQMRTLIEQSWTGGPPDVSWVNDHLASIQDQRGQFDYVLSINVVEHVAPIRPFIAECIEMARPGGKFRFICPNYSFPYEPHFNIPTLFAKRPTAALFARKIDSPEFLEGRSLWNELSWPTVHRLKTILRDLQLPHVFSPTATQHYVERATQDLHFAQRKGPLLAWTGKAMMHVPTGAYRYLPVSLLPIIDCTVTRPDTWRAP